MSEFPFTGIAFAQQPAAPVAPIVNIGSPSPSTGEEGNSIIDWQITYTGTVTDYSLAFADLTFRGSWGSNGTWVVIDGTTSTPYVRFISDTGFGTDCSFLVKANAVYNDGVGNAATGYATNATITEDEGK